MQPDLFRTLSARLDREWAWLCNRPAVVGESSRRSRPTTRYRQHRAVTQTRRLLAAA